MKAYQVDFEDRLDILDKSKVLHTWSTLGGMTVHVVEFSGNDVLIIGSILDGSAVVIESDDAAFGGSTHYHVRNALRLGTL